LSRLSAFIVGASQQNVRLLAAALKKFDFILDPTCCPDLGVCDRWLARVIKGFAHHTERYAEVEPQIRTKAKSESYVDCWEEETSGPLGLVPDQLWDLAIVYGHSNSQWRGVFELLETLDRFELDLPVLIVTHQSPDQVPADIPVKLIQAGVKDYIFNSDLDRLGLAIVREQHNLQNRKSKLKAERSLRVSQANLSALIENTQDAAWSVDQDLRLVIFNAQFRSLLQSVSGRFFTSQPIQAGLSLVDILPETWQSAWLGYYRRGLAGERFAIEQETGDQALEISFSPILNAAGIVTGVTAFGRDVTARRRAEQAFQQARDQLQAVLDAVPGCVSWFTSDLIYRGINRYLAESFNLPPDQFVGRQLGFMESSPGFANLVRDFFASAADSQTLETKAQVNGSDRTYLIVAQKYDQGRAAVFVGLDITDRRQMEEALRDSQERYALAVQGANDGLWDWDLRCDRIYFGIRWKSMLGWPEDGIGDHPDEWFQRIHPDDLDRVKAELYLHLENLTSHFESEYRIAHRDGSYRWMLSRGLAVRDPSGRAYRMAGSQTDITERKQAEEQLLQNAFYDRQTNLPNRALFLELLGRVVERSKRLNSNLFAVLYIDLDHFKLVNDSLGRLSGDTLLSAIASVARSLLCPSCTLSRLGEDEFGVLKDNLRDFSEATSLADQIQSAFQSPFCIQEQEIFMTACVGIALAQPGYDRAEDLLRDANIAVHRAKSKGTAQQAIFNEDMYAAVVARLNLEMDLRSALERQEFCVYYQPIVDLKTGKISGFEALIRWHHPLKGIVSPGQFIPIAEENGLIIPIGVAVLQQACQQIRQWQQQFQTQPSLTISVNLSARQFAQVDLVQQVSTILDQVGLSANQLKLEITETIVMDQAEVAIGLLQQLNALGIQLQIDDFGTGYSSFSYLHQFPIHTLKLDRAFVCRLGAADDSFEIVRAIISLAHNLGMTVTSEGIETVDQLQQLQALGSDHGQGYFFSKPLSAEATTEFLANFSEGFVLLTQAKDQASAGLGRWVGGMSLP